MGLGAILAVAFGTLGYLGREAYRDGMVRGDSAAGRFDARSDAPDPEQVFRVVRVQPAICDRAAGQTVDELVDQRILAVANLVGRGWSVVMGLVFIPLYVRYMGIEAYGLVGLFTTLQALFSLLDLGMSAALNREFARQSATPGGHRRDPSRPAPARSGPSG